VALVRERTITSERQPLSAKLVPTFADRVVSCSQSGGFPTAVISVFLDWTSDYHIVKYFARQTIKCTSVFQNEQSPWPQSASELYRLSDRRLMELVPPFVDRRCRVVSVTDPYDRILGFPDRSRYFFFQTAPQLYSRGCWDPVPDPLFLRISGSAGNRTGENCSLGRFEEI
jgi:hypothetical protein